MAGARNTAELECCNRRDGQERDDQYACGKQRLQAHTALRVRRRIRNDCHGHCKQRELDAAGVALKSNTVCHGRQRYNLLRYIFRQHAPRHKVRKHHTHRPRQRSSVGGHAFGSARRRHERHGSICERHGQSKADAFGSLRRIRQRHHLVHDYRRADGLPQTARLRPARWLRRATSRSRPR